MKNYWPIVLMVYLLSACSDFKGNEDSVVSSLAPPVCDNSTPEISEVTAIGTTEDTTPDYVFSSTHSGPITYSGSCSSSTTSANIGNNTITLNELIAGKTYNDCGIEVTDSCSGLSSDNLSLGSITISEPCDNSDNSTPTLTESVRIGLNKDNNTNDTSPNYIFASNESGTISYGGSCKSTTTSASIGNNTITLRQSNNSWFSHGTYNDCTLRVMDCNGNISDNLSISPFKVYIREELYSVTYGNGHFIAVGDNGRILTSSTGDNNSWTVQESGTTSDLYDVETDNHTFVAVGYRGKLIRSVDNGTTWTTPSTWGQSSISGTTTTLSAVAGQIDNISGNNDFVIVTNAANGKIGYSSDNGSTWSTGVDFTSTDLAYGDDAFVGEEFFIATGSDGALQKSVDGGRSWNLSNISSQDLNGISFGSGSYIQNTTSIASFNDNYSVEKTGIDNLSNIVDHDNHTNGSYTNVSFIGGSGYGAKGTVTVSGNNITDISITTPGYNYQIGDNLTIDNDTIGGSDNASFLVSSTRNVDLTENTYNDVSLNSNSGSGAKATIVISGDNISSIVITNKGTGYSIGDNITIDNSSLSANFPGRVEIWVNELYSYQVNWGVFVIVADAGVILYSNDNTSNWQQAINNDSTNNLFSVAYGDRKFVASGYNNKNSWNNPGGVVLVSNDNGTNWTLKTSNYVFEDLTYGNGKFVGVQFKQYQSGYGWTYERIYTSTDGENWTLVHDPNY